MDKCEHKPKWNTLAFGYTDGKITVVDVVCVTCNQSGSAVIEPTAINWD